MCSDTVAKKKSQTAQSAYSLQEERTPTWNLQYEHYLCIFVIMNPCYHFLKIFACLVKSLFLIIFTSLIKMTLLQWLLLIFWGVSWLVLWISFASACFEMCYACWIIACLRKRSFGDSISQVNHFTFVCAWCRAFDALVNRCFRFHVVLCSNRFLFSCFRSTLRISNCF